MTRFARSFRSFKDKVRTARAANEWTRRMYAPDTAPMDYSNYDLDHKRAAPVRDPNVPSEHQSQAAVISWWALECKQYELPPFALFAIPNGGARDAITGSRLKQEGVRAGILDLMLAVKRGDFGGLFVEMKKLGNRPSPAQQEVMDYLARAGYERKVCWTSHAAIAAIKEYLGS